MTDKERYGFDVEREMRHLKGIVEKNDTLTISNRFTRYLIEQAERVQELKDIIYQDERQGRIEDLYEENKRYREALEILNRVSASDMKDEQLTSSHFVLDITGDALREGWKLDMNEILQDEAEYFGSIIQERDEKIKRYEDILQFYANKE